MNAHASSWATPSRFVASCDGQGDTVAHTINPAPSAPATIAVVRERTDRTRGTTSAVTTTPASPQMSAAAPLTPTIPTHEGAPAGAGTT